MSTIELTPSLRKDTSDLQNDDPDMGENAFDFFLAATPNLPSGTAASVRYDPGQNIVVNFSNKANKWSATKDNVSSLPMELQGFAKHIYETTSHLVHPNSTVDGTDPRLGEIPYLRYTLRQNAFIPDGNAHADALEKIQRQLEDIRAAVDELKDN